MSTEVEKMGKMIDLGRIDHGRQDLNDVLGISIEEYERCVQEIKSCNPLRIQREVKRFGFSKEEIVKSLKNNRCISEAVVDLWKRTGREKIYLKEFILTAKLIKRVNRENRSEGIPEILEIRVLEIGGLEEILKRTRLNEIIEEELVERRRKRIIQFVREHGTPVLPVMMESPSCVMWRKKHGGSSKGCPSELGCAKVNLITETLIELSRFQPKSLKNFIEVGLWMNITIKAIEIILDILTAKSLEELKKFSST